MQKLLVSLMGLVVIVGVDGKNTDSPPSLYRLSLATAHQDEVETWEDSGSTGTLTIFERDVEPAQTEEAGPQEGQEEAFRCNICQENFARRSLLQTHHRDTHSRPQPTSMHLCRVCNRPFQTRSDLRSHELRNHTRG